MSIFSDISSNLTAHSVLESLGIECAAGRRIPCPVHGGDGKNFSVSPDGTRATCFSRCGQTWDAIDLYCMIKHGSRLRALDANTKKRAISALAGLAGVREGKRQNQPRPSSPISPAEHFAFRSICEDTSLLDGYGPEPLHHVAIYRSRQMQRAVLFLMIARSMGELPDKIDSAWPHRAALMEFANGRDC